MFDPVTHHSLEDGTAGIEDSPLQGINVNNSISKGKFPGSRPDPTKFGTLWRSTTTSPEEICTVSDGSNSRNFKLDARLGGAPQKLLHIHTFTNGGVEN